MSQKCLDTSTTGMYATAGIFLEHNGGHHAWARSCRGDCARMVAHWSIRNMAARLLQGSANKLCLSGNRCSHGARWATQLLRRQPESKGLPFAAT
ncbi:conserved hypothetical protein [Mycobacterium marinum E11]|nr:conserved hypothetical protein [Mycobacterium marinum E11]